MKCDELKFERLGDANETYPASTLVIRKQFVDAAIAELKAENENIKYALGGTTIAYKQVCDEYELCDKVLRATKRALWMARADRAMMALDYFTLKCRWFKDYMKVEPPGCDVKMISKWANISRKCRAKAEEYYK